MDKFITKIARQIYHDKGAQLENLIVIMPSKRAGTFFKKALAECSDAPVWVPKIYAIEEWLEELSELSIAGKTQLLFEMYVSYLKVVPKKDCDSFERFLKWAPTLLKDFNDIDAYLENPQKLFDYIHEVKKIESWSPNGAQPSSMVSEYIHFWELMGALFVEFKTQLEKKNIAFQGMAYRKAANQISSWVAKNTPKKGSICYIGFNAMNPCETHIMKTLLSEGSAEVFWDADSYYLYDKKQEAGKYLRKYKNWSEFQNRDFNWVHSELTKQKKIRVFGVPKTIAQAQLAGSILNDFYTNTETATHKDVALVLADETLLSPVLEYLPRSTDKVNVTMGNALKNVHMYAFFNSVFHLHLNRERLHVDQGLFYYKDLYKIWQHPAFQCSKSDASIEKIKDAMRDKNLSFVSLENVYSYCDLNFLPWAESLMKHDDSNVFGFIDNLLNLIELIKCELVSQKKGGLVLLEELFAFTKLFNQIKTLQDEYGFITELKTLYHLFQQCARIETMSFYGEPLSGLQIMGMLETRNLDFENVILLSVNEGFLPSGKTENSYIPFDIRKEFNLPTYEDMDAVFAYHFYRLAQRCKSLTLIYNTESDALGSGEKSRYIAQMENELVAACPEIDYREQILSHEIQKVIPREFRVEKDAFVLSRLKDIATNKGFSPSSLNTYKKCPLQFYYEKVLRIKNPNSIEETIEASTLGTIIHRALEDFYLPFVGEKIKSEDLKTMRLQIRSKLELLFSEEFKNDSFSRGKNKLIFTVAEQFLNAFIKQEEVFIRAGKTVDIIGLEEDLATEITLEDFNFSVKLIGNADRIDKVNGCTRIIDYKTGKVELREVQSDEMLKLTRDDRCHKGFQLFLYAYMYNKMHPKQKPLEAGIISFRALKGGFLKAGIKLNKKVNSDFDDDLLDPFESELKSLIKEIFDPSVPFSHSEREEYCRFCDPEKFRP